MRRRRTVPNEKGREGLYLWRKDRTCENDSLTKAVELEKEAVFGRLEEPHDVVAWMSISASSWPA